MNNTLKKLKEQRVQLKRLNKAVIHWKHVAELACAYEVIKANQYQELYERFCKEQEGRCFWCKKFRGYT